MCLPITISQSHDVPRSYIPSRPLEDAVTLSLGRDLASPEPGRQLQPAPVSGFQEQMFGAEEQVPGHDDRYFVADGDPCSFTLRYSERFQQDCGLFAAPSLSQVTPQPRQHGSDEQMFGAN